MGDISFLLRIRWITVLIHPDQKEVDAWMKIELRNQGFRSRPARPSEMFGPYKVIWYWWHPERMEKLK